MELALGRKKQLQLKAPRFPGWHLSPLDLLEGSQALTEPGPWPLDTGDGGFHTDF